MPRGYRDPIAPSQKALLGGQSELLLDWPHAWLHEACASCYGLNYGGYGLVRLRLASSSPLSDLIRFQDQLSNLQGGLAIIEESDEQPIHLVWKLLLYKVSSFIQEDGIEVCVAAVLNINNRSEATTNHEIDDQSGDNGKVSSCVPSNSRFSKKFRYAVRDASVVTVEGIADVLEGSTSLLLVEGITVVQDSIFV
ncbi:hypothetical protein Scep_001674 [Stephania cephalantha]|uniref:Uncharacterized protein n=1 Tax=Stephania cephalantha TaxID=152367 RepID=A0AAP0L8I0_9MAGN